MIRRDSYVEKLIRLSGNGNVKVVTGIRRCGKSYLLDKLLKRRLAENGCGSDRIVSVSLELKRNEKLRNPDALHGHLVKALKRIRGRAVVFVDELQMALPGLCGYASIVDLRRVFRQRIGMTMREWQQKTVA